MKILQLCFRLPFPLNDGGAIAMYNMMKGFMDSGCEVTLAVPSTSKHSVVIDHLPPVFGQLKNFHSCTIHSDITIHGAILNLFTTAPYYLSRYKSSKFTQLLKRILRENEFDVIQVESLKMSCYLDVIRKYSNAKVIIRSHNVEYLVWKRYANSLPPGLKKIYLNLMVRRLKKYETASLHDFDAVVPITGYDSDIYKGMGCKLPLIPIACGIDADKLLPDRSAVEENSLFHLGALDWMPNLDAVQWFLESIWPVLHQKYPLLKFYLAGKNMPPSFHKYCIENVTVSGEVEDAVKFMNSKSIMVVPLRSGSGMRIKIIEGMALGKVVISTTIGAEGIAYKDRENILIADTPGEFLQCMDMIQNIKNFADSISQAARKLAEQNYDNRKIVAGLVQKYEHLIK